MSKCCRYGCDADATHFVGNTDFGSSSDTVYRGRAGNQFCEPHAKNALWSRILQAQSLADYPIVRVLK